MVSESLNPHPDESHRVATTDDIEVSTYLEIAREVSGEQSSLTEEAVSGAEREAIIVLDFGLETKNGALI